MKVVSSKQMSHIESLAYRDGASEVDFMEEAGSGVALVVHDYADRHQIDRHITLLCGKGNNAGDAYVAGIHLLHLDYEVLALQIAPLESCSQLCRDNYHRFLNDGGRVRHVGAPEDISFPKQGVIVDGIFGTGFKGKVQEPYASAIQAANDSKLPIIAVDIPSGLNGETGEVESIAIYAQETAFLSLPKTGFFLKDGWNHVGKLRYVDFGLPHNYVEESDADLIMLDKDLLLPQLPPIIRNRHKYQAGYVVGLAGSPDMPGAALLSSLATLRSGAGIMRLFYPAGMEIQLSSAPYEVIKEPFHLEDADKVIETMNKASATFVGPGLGRSPQITELLRKVLPALQKPCVIDADALFFLAEEEVTLPKQCVLTPHLGELLRLTKQPAPHGIDMAFLESLQHFVESKQITLVLKGGPSFILHPDEMITVNPTGDPGMATAGSGDVLTGLIAALLAQGATPHQAAQLGVYIHGLAGEHAAHELSSYCMTASDIIFYFPEGFRFMEL